MNRIRVFSSGFLFVFAIYCLLKNPNLPFNLTIDGPLLRKTLSYGSVTALQQACQPIGKLLIQGTVNSLGVDMIAAFNTTLYKGRQFSKKYFPNNQLD